MEVKKPSCERDTRIQQSEMELLFSLGGIVIHSVAMGSQRQDYEKNVSLWNIVRVLSFTLLVIFYRSSG